LWHPQIELPVFSFMAEAYQRAPEVPRIACVSITQTAAEKFVALTRRVATEIADDDKGNRDKTLIRHVYDLHVIREHYNCVDVAALVRDIMPHDAKEYGNQFPAYRENPLVETLRAIQALTSDDSYAQCYAEFHRNMVYAEKAVDYRTCLETLKKLSHLIEM
jgi:hypothetical protein